MPSLHHLKPSICTTPSLFIHLQSQVLQRLGISLPSGWSQHSPLLASLFTPPFAFVHPLCLSIQWLQSQVPQWTGFPLLFPSLSSSLCPTPSLLPHPSSHSLTLHPPPSLSCLSPLPSTLSPSPPHLSPSPSIPPHLLMHPLSSLSLSASPLALSAHPSSSPSLHLSLCTSSLLSFVPPFSPLLCTSLLPLPLLCTSPLALFLHHSSPSPLFCTSLLHASHLTLTLIASLP